MRIDWTGLLLLLVGFLLCFVFPSIITLLIGIPLILAGSFLVVLGSALRRIPPLHNDD
jgi:hypothetical protein